MAYLTHFYRVFHSMRYVGGRLVLRLEHPIGDDDLERLNEQFADIVVTGRIEPCEPAPAEVADDDALDKARIRFRFTNSQYARLHALIRTINSLDAP